MYGKKSASQLPIYINAISTETNEEVSNIFIHWTVIKTTTNTVKKAIQKNESKHVVLLHSKTFAIFRPRKKNGELSHGKNIEILL